MLIADYTAAGFALVPIPPGAKGPQGPKAKGWNIRERCKLPLNWHGNIGLAHAYSSTCAIDFDDLAKATAWLSERGVDAAELLCAPDAVRISSGRDNRAKLLYRLDTPLRSLQLADGALEFRCGTANGKTVQDVLPPSIHPDTGKPYTWELGVAADWRDPPPLPEALRQLWQSLLERPVKPAAPSSDSDKPEPAGVQRVREALKDHDPSCPEPQWFDVLAAIHWETQGSAEGLDLADEWSSDGSNYTGREAIETRWERFTLDHPNPRTLASLRIDKPAAPDEFPEIGDEPASHPAKTARFTPIQAGEFSAGREIDWLIHGLIPQAELFVLYGESGAGKTFMMVDLLMAVVRGEPWRDRRVKQGGVVYICAEGVGGFRRRLKAYAHQYQVNLSELPLYVIADAPNLLERVDALALAKAIITVLRPSLIIVDTLSATTPGANENAGEDMGRAIAHCKGLHKATGAVVGLVHHSGKDAAKGARGWSGLRAAADAELEVTRQGEERVLTVTKMKDGEDGIQFGFKLVTVSLGLDAYGDTIDSCVVEAVAVKSISREEKGPKGAAQRIVFNAARDLLAEQLDGEPVDVGAVIRAAADKLTWDGEGRDRRLFLAGRALDTLVAGNFLHVEHGRASLCN